MYSVLRQRHGRVLSEDMRDGEECFVIHARLPVIESFGLTNDLRKRTSGNVNLPQLRPGGWEILDTNPLQRDAIGTVSAISETHQKIYQRQRHQEAILTRLRRRARDNDDKGNSAAADADELDDGTASDKEQEQELMLDEVNSQLVRLRTYIRDVRRRKGLNTHEQLVISADKQRTLKKNK